ncbi:enoyl-CoA hydratase/isomerase family protein [Novosphingobium bradum]|uniref:Enoyl-CoA hydratase/isomerase family protein n=1 Tax=Novosphingobium bradum TaxID=1737444 RepID=A0ABV7IQR3_9SPHN
MPITIEHQGAVALITIDRPERKNAITLAMRAEIESAFRAADDDPAVRAIVLTGGGGDFSAGADVSEMGEGGIGRSLYRVGMLHRMARGVAGTGKPVIAAVRGVCIGVSWSLALASDMVITAADARFQFAFRHIGLAPDGGAAFLLTRYLPLQRAKEIMYSGRFVSGQEAVDLGLALEALPADDVLPRALELAQSLAQAPTLALTMAKRQFDAAPVQTYDQALEFEKSMQALMLESRDFREGSSAFKEKRKPSYTGE